MGGGKGKKKDLNAKLTTNFSKHTKVRNRTVEKKINSLFYKTDTDAKQANTDAKPTVMH